MFMDELAQEKNDIHKVNWTKANENDDQMIVETRSLNQSTFRIVKVYYTPQQLHDKLSLLGLHGEIEVTPGGKYYSACLKMK